MKIKIPYTLNLLYPIVGWGILCASFAYFFVLTMGSFEQPGTKGAFSASVPIYILFFFMISTMKFAGIGFLGTADVKNINKNFTKKGLNAGVGAAETEKTFYSIVSLCRDTINYVLFVGIAIIILVIFTVLANGISTRDIIIILLAGAVAIFFWVSFSSFFYQQTMFSAMKECRRIMVERNEKIEDVRLSGISSKFSFLFLLPFFTVGMVLACIFPINFNLLAVSIIGLFMTFIIDRILFTYLSNSFLEIESFAKDLPKGERAIFTTGSLDKEFVDLAQNLNEASEEIYSSRKDSEKSKAEMEKRVVELEKFFDLTVNREMKMVELKKQIKKMEENVQKNKA
jgi:hypothetical protein